MILLATTISSFASKSYEKIIYNVGDYTIETNHSRINVSNMYGKVVRIGYTNKIKWYDKSFDNIKVIATDNGRKEDNKIELIIDGELAVEFNSQWIKKARATLVTATKPDGTALAIWAKPYGKASIALNVEDFQKKINKAIAKAYKKVAKDFDLTVEQVKEIHLGTASKIVEDEINKVINNEVNDKINKEVNDKVNESVNDAVQQSVDVALSESVQNELDRQLDNLIYTETGRAVEDAVQREISDAVQRNIEIAIEAGVDQATLDAAVSAFNAELGRGGTIEEANAAARAVCNGQCS